MFLGPCQRPDTGVQSRASGSRVPRGPGCHPGRSSVCLLCRASSRPLSSSTQHWVSCHENAQCMFGKRKGPEHRQVCVRHFQRQTDTLPHVCAVCRSGAHPPERPVRHGAGMALLTRERAQTAMIREASLPTRAKTARCHRHPLGTLSCRLCSVRDGPNTDHVPGGFSLFEFGLALQRDLNVCAQKQILILLQKLCMLFFEKLQNSG